MSWHASLPAHAPTVVCQNTTFVRDPEKIQYVAESERRREFTALIRQYIHQILHGCQRDYCDTPTCWTARRRRKSCREFTPLSARVIATQLATADDPYRALCPGVPAAIVGKLVGDKVDRGLKDHKSFTQQLFDTVPLRKLEWLGLPLPSDILNFPPEGKAADGDKEEDEDEEEKEEKGGTTELGSPGLSIETITPLPPPQSNVVTLSMSIPPGPHTHTPQHSQQFSAYFTTPHQSPPPRIRKFNRQKSYNNSNDGKESTTSQEYPFTPSSHPKSAPPLPSRGAITTPSNTHNMPPPPPPPRHHHHNNAHHMHRTQSTPSKVHAPNGGSVASPASTVGDTYTIPPQSVTHFTADIVRALAKMCDDKSSARGESNGFVRQSIWYVFTTPDAIDASFVLQGTARDEIFNAHPSDVDAALRVFMEKGWSRDVFHALWKAVGELFPKVVAKTVKPSPLSEKVAAKVVIIALHALAASLRKSSPEVWEETRRVRSLGQVSNKILIEDELAMRLTCRLVRALASYRLFNPGIMAHLRHYFSFCGVVSETERVGKLSKELGRELGAEVAASRIGRGGWGLAVCTLEWARGALLAEWDGEERLKKGSVAEGAVLLMKFLFDNHEPFGLDPLYFQNPVLADRLDAKDVPVEWYLSKSKSVASSHLLDHPYLFPPSALVTFFRSINFHIMSYAYDLALSNNRFIHQISNTVELQKYLTDSLYKRSKVSMTMYLLLEVSRETIVRDALDQIVGRQLRECSRPLKVRFLDVGEEGVDHGGVQQEFFSVLWAEVLKPEYGIFITDPGTRMSWFAIAGLEPLHKIELLGILASLAVYNAVTLPISFPVAFYRKLLGYPVTDIEHIEDGWPELARGLRAMLKWDETDGDVADVFVRGYEFSYEAWGKVWNVDMLRTKREDPWSPPTIERTHVHVVHSDEEKEGDDGGSCPQLPEDIVYFSDDGSEVGRGRLGIDIARSTPEREGEEEEEIVTPFKVHEDPDAAEDRSWEDVSREVVGGGILAEKDAPGESPEEALRVEGGEGEEQEAEIVSNETRRRFVSDYIFWLTDKSVRRQFEAFERGFRSCLDAKALSLFTPTSLQRLIEGSRDIDVSALEAAARYDDGYSPSHRLIRDFWSVVRSFGPERKRQLLEFVTASDRVPVNGIGNLMFVIQRNGPDSERVPTSLTCFGRLLLPEYSSKRKLREKLKLALENGKGFGVP